MGCSAPQNSTRPTRRSYDDAMSWITALTVVVGLSSPVAELPVSKGHLVAVGGGGTPPAVLERAIALAGGDAARVAVLPQASQSDDAGAALRAFWKKAGARVVDTVDLGDVTAAKRILKTATLIWIGGGSQTRFMTQLREAGLADVLRARHRDGAVVGGTSAGAAVLSEIMIGGRGDDRSLVRGAMTPGRGIGVWPGVIVDQHFAERRRFNRLLSTVLDHPGHVGVGIGERTAVIVSKGEWEVRGKGSVVVVDGRAARRRKTQPGQPWSATEVAVHTLRAGDRWKP